MQGEKRGINGGMEIVRIYEGEEFLYFNIWVTLRCNYACTYCYENDKNQQYMNEDIANQVVKYINEMCCELRKNIVWINFHGGEPLLNKYIIKYIINSLKLVRDDIKIYTSMTTNCSIYDKEICEYINELTVSIDGVKSSHDRNRKYIDGTGTYDTSIVNAMKYLKEKKEIRLRMVVTSNNVEQLYENVVHLYNLGFTEVIPGIDYYDGNWTEELFEELYSQLLKLRDYREKNKANDLFIGILDEDIKEKGKCVVGCDGYQISVEGKIYPCILVVQQPRYCIGDIYNGMNYDKIQKLNELNEKDVEECKDCGNYKYCVTSRCLMLNEQLTGDCYVPSAIICSVERVKLRLRGLI